MSLQIFLFCGWFDISFATPAPSVNPSGLWEWQHWRNDYEVHGTFHGLEYSDCSVGHCDSGFDTHNWITGLTGCVGDNTAIYCNSQETVYSGWSWSGTAPCCNAGCSNCLAKANRGDGNSCSSAFYCVGNSGYKSISVTYKIDNAQIVDLPRVEAGFTMESHPGDANLSIIGDDTANYVLDNMVVILKNITGVDVSDSYILHNGSYTNQSVSLYAFNVMIEFDFMNDTYMTHDYLSNNESFQTHLNSILVYNTSDFENIFVSFIEANIHTQVNYTDDDINNSSSDQNLVRQCFSLYIPASIVYLFLLMY